MLAYFYPLRYDSQLMGDLRQVQIELVGRCNLSCSYCTWQKRTVAKGMNMPIDMAKSLIDQCQAMGVELVTYHSLGESLLHPEFNDIAKYADEHIVSNRLATNCTLLTGDVAKTLRRLKSFQLILSVHWVAGEKFALRSVEAIKEYIASKPVNRDIRIQMICDRRAIGDYDRFMTTFLPVVEGVENASIYLKQPCTFPTDTRPAEGFVNLEHAYNKKVLMDRQRTPYSIGRGCTQPEYFLSILADGSVVPCCVGMEDWHLPSVRDNTLRQVWESERMSKIRDLWRAQDDSIPCGHCLKRTDC